MELVAQLVVHQTDNLGVVGSSPTQLKMNMNNPLKRKIKEKAVVSSNTKDKRLLVEKIMQLGVLGYSNRNKSLYKDKVKSFKNSIGKEFKGLEIFISGRIRGARRARSTSVNHGRV